VSAQSTYHREEDVEVLLNADGGAETEVAVLRDAFDHEDEADCGDREHAGLEEGEPPAAEL